MDIIPELSREETPTSTTDTTETESGIVRGTSASYRSDIKEVQPPTSHRTAELRKKFETGSDGNITPTPQKKIPHGPPKSMEVPPQQVLHIQQQQQQQHTIQEVEASRFQIQEAAPKPQVEVSRSHVEAQRAQIEAYRTAMEVPRSQVEIQKPQALVTSSSSSSATASVERPLINLNSPPPAHLYEGVVEIIIKKRNGELLGEFLG